jgi:hypothetical protein
VQIERVHHARSARADDEEAARGGVEALLGERRVVEPLIDHGDDVRLLEVGLGEANHVEREGLRGRAAEEEGRGAVRREAVAERGHLLTKRVVDAEWRGDVQLARRRMQNTLRVRATGLRVGQVEHLRGALIGRQAAGHRRRADVRDLCRNGEVDPGVLVEELGLRIDRSRLFAGTDDQRERASEGEQARIEHDGHFQFEISCGRLGVPQPVARSYPGSAGKPAVAPPALLPVVMS